VSYATVAQLREYLSQIPASETTDALLQDVLDRANRVVDGYLGFSFGAYAEGDKDVRAPRNPDEWLEVPTHDAGTVTAVLAVSGRGSPGESTSAVMDYLEEDDGRLYRDAGWSANAWYRVSADWGYGEAPADVVEVELRVAVNIWQGRAASQWSSNVGVEGSGAVTYSRALTAAERSMLDAVRREAGEWGFA